MGRRLRFDGYTVDLDARTVEADGAPISLEPQVFDVLAMLIEHRERVVSKLELLDTVWGDRFVSPSTLTSRIRDLRAALGDSGQRQRVVKTAHGRGFRFVAEVELLTDAGDGGSRSDRPGKPLIGRDDLLVDLHRRLDECRLVTLVGPGGAGKTHLMRHAIAGRDAVVVDLTDVREVEALVRTVLGAAGGVERPDVDALDAVVDLLGGRSTVLVLDNCEHVIDAATATTDALLRRCPQLRILTTSRRPLRLTDESVLRVGPLESDAAVELFVRHAARHGVELDLDRGRDPVVELCERLDRLPLALELAASKSRAISVEDLTRLLDDRLGMLTADAADADDHHASLDTTIRWSVELLTGQQRALLARLSVFVGPFDLEAVEAVCVTQPADRLATIADLLALVDLSLVQFDPGIARYRLLESVRMFAEGLGVHDETRSRFREHVLSVVESAAMLPAVSFSADLEAIRSVWPGLRAVVADARARSDAETLHRSVAAATRFAEQTFAFEVSDWAEWAIEFDGDASPPATRLAAVLLLTHRSEFDAAADHLRHVDGADPAMVELARLWLSYFTGELAAADAASDRIREIDGGAGSYPELVAATASHFLDKGAGRPFAPDAVATIERWARSGDPVAVAGAELCAAVRLDWETQAELALEQLTATIDDARRLGLAFLASGAMTARSIVVATAPEAESSVRVLRATLRSYAEVGSWQFALADFASTALALAEHGLARDAAELLGARRAAGYVGDSSADVEQRAVMVAKRRLGDRAFDDAVRQGAARDTPNATRLALAALDRLIDESG